MNSGTISTRCHQFHPKTHRVCCLSLCKASEHLFHPDITKTVI